MDYRIVYSDRRTVSLSVKDGEIVVRAPRYVSRQRIEELLLSHRDWISKKIEKQEKRMARFSSLSDEDIKKLRKMAKNILSEKTSHYANIMGLKYGRITITSAKSRFGSCSAEGNISYSYRLMLYPEEAIDYVVVHGLAHLVEMNHSPAFYAIVAKVLPDYKSRAKLLKE